MEKENVNNVLVAGAGIMGSSIAQLISMGDMGVTLVDVDQKVLGRAMDLIESGLNTMADFEKISRDKIPSILARITPSTDLSGMAHDADFIIEAVSEVPEVKKRVFSQLEASCPAEAIIASNTSGLDIFSIAEAKRPERFIIAHFFAPAHIIPLVEVVPGVKTSSETLSKTVHLMERLGRNPVVMKKYGPGFIVNRIQKAIGEASFEMIEEGLAEPAEIDRAIKLSLGIRLPIIGVIQTFDFQGLDMLLDTMRNYGKVYSFIEEKVKEGRLGSKTSIGIYDYEGRSESEILKKRDGLFLKMIDFLQEINAFEPV